MSIFGDIIETECPQIPEEDREMLLLDYAFDVFCDSLIIDINTRWEHSSKKDSVQWVDGYITDTLEKMFKHMFLALDHGCPLPWFPDSMAPYKILYLSNVEFKLEKEVIYIDLNYRDGQKLKKRTFIFNKSWL